MPNDLRLHAESLWISPYVFSSFVALMEKGLNFEVAQVKLIDGEHQSSRYRALSLTARVPCLEHDGFTLSESSAIAEYLEECFAPQAYPRLLPESVTARARARQLMAWLRSDLMALREDRSTVTMFYQFQLAALSAAAERDTAKLIHLAKALIPPNAGSLFGDWSLVDSELAFMLHRLLLNGHDLPEKVRAYAEREWQRPTVQAFVNQPRPKALPESYWEYAGTPRPRVK